MKRYAIVRVDKECAKCENLVIYDNGKVGCKVGMEIVSCRYGDTKEQLINKVAQVLARKYLRDLKCATYKNSDVIANDIKNFYKLAKEIVEFLGVNK